MLYVVNYEMQIIKILILAIATYSTNSAIIQNNVFYDAVPEQYPYHVRLSAKINDISFNMCDGTLISNKWVLTAAYCSDGADSVVLYLGTTSGSSPELTYTVTKDNITIHPEWNKNSVKNDISLIKIPHVNYTTNIQPVKMSNISKFYTNYAGENVITSRWVSNLNTSADVSNNLQWASMKVIDNSECEQIYGNSIVTSSSICTSNPGDDVGGFLFLKDSPVLIGILSTVRTEKDYPVVFTRITSFLDWIGEITANYEINFDSVISSLSVGIDF